MAEFWKFTFSCTYRIPWRSVRLFRGSENCDNHTQKWLEIVFAYDEIPWEWYAVEWKA